MQDRMTEVIEILLGKLPAQYQMIAKTLLTPYMKSIDPETIPEFCETARALLDYIQYGSATEPLEGK